MTGEPATPAVEHTVEEILEERARSLALEALEEAETDLVALLLFRIADEWYAVRVSDVREVFQEYDVTPIPCLPEFILGVTNVRGEIISVTDPALMSSVGRVVGAAGERPPSIVITNGKVTTALVVDEVGDITEIPSEALEPPVSIIDRAQAEFIAASACVDETMVGVLNVDRILAPLGAARGQ
jgi:purine-binding chemotaxis protein CheW